VLLDRRQTPWVIATVAAGAGAVGLYVWLDRRTPGGLTGGSTVGLWYGVAGSLLMVYAGLLAAHRSVPALWWLVGPRQTWLRGHIWLGLLSVVVIACHAHARLGGPLEIALWLVLAAVILSGVYGLFLQQVLPRWLARRFPDEAPYGQIPYLCRRLRERADELVDEVAPETAVKVADSRASFTEETFAAELRTFHDRLVRPFLAAPAPPGSELITELHSDTLFSALRTRLGLRRTDRPDDAPDSVAAALDELEELCRDRRRLAEQERLHHWLHTWLLLHVPLSAALLVLGVAHAVTALYY
jgi:hypothetical protein